MKNTTLARVTLSAVCALLALPVLAIDATFTITPESSARVHIDKGVRGARVDSIDTNSDDKISLEEFVTAQLSTVAGMIKQRDTNNDGLLTEEELQPQRPEGRPLAAGRPPIAPGQAGGGPRMHRPDAANGTAPSVSEREAVKTCLENAGLAPRATPPADREERFDLADTNADGKLSLAELTAATTKRATEEFSRMDVDKDGFLTQADRDAARDQHEENASAARACLKPAK